MRPAARRLPPLAASRPAIICLGVAGSPLCQSYGRHIKTFVTGPPVVPVPWRAGGPSPPAPCSFGVPSLRLLPALGRAARQSSTCPKRSGPYRRQTFGKEALFRCTHRRLSAATSQAPRGHETNDSTCVIIPRTPMGGHTPKLSATYSPSRPPPLADHLNWVFAARPACPRRTLTYETQPAANFWLLRSHQNAAAFSSP